MKQKPIVLQERVTLDEVLLREYQVYPNGCRLRVVEEKNGDTYIEHGCVGVLPGQLLEKWLGRAGRRQLDGVVLPQTMLELISRRPCTKCGGARFAA